MQPHGALRNSASPGAPKTKNGEENVEKDAVKRKTENSFRKTREKIVSV